MFVGQSIDVFVKERHASNYDADRLAITRMLVGGKPVSFLGHWLPKSGWPLEKTICKLLLFGVAPGSRLDEAQRPLLRKYMPVLSAMAAAGWQPVTYAKAKLLHVERFGAKPGRLFFAVGNRGAKRVTDRVVIDADSLGLSGLLRIKELVSNQPVCAVRRGRQLLVNVTVEPFKTLVLAVQRGQA